MPVGIIEPSIEDAMEGANDNVMEGVIESSIEDATEGAIDDVPSSTNLHLGPI